MSLPSGLVFFLDFTKSDNGADRDGQAGASIFGGGTSVARLVLMLTATKKFLQPYQGFTGARGGISSAAARVARVGADIALDGDLSEAEQQRLSFDADLCATNGQSQRLFVLLLTDAHAASTI